MVAACSALPTLRDDDWTIFDAFNGLFNGAKPAQHKASAYKLRGRVGKGLVTVWSPSLEDAEDSVELMKSSDIIAPELVSKGDVRPEIRHRLLELIRYSIQDNEPLPRSDSLAGLNGFLETYSTVRRPLLTSDDEGFLVATWRISDSSMLSFRFLDREAIQYAWALEDGRGQVNRKWGEVAWGDFMSSFRYVKDFLGLGS
jgi:hypothetical protein